MQEDSKYRTSNFFFSFLFLNRKRKNALKIFYKFARLVDDIADGEEEISEKEEKLKLIKKEIEELYNGKKPENDFYNQIYNIINTFNIPAECFIGLIDGVMIDIYSPNIKTLNELEDYMYKVASLVGIAVLKICGYDGKDIKEISQYTGYALQITNILRDIEEDIRRNRYYIPLEHRKKFFADNIMRTDTEEFKKLFEFEKEIARGYYDKSSVLFKKNKNKSLFVPLLMKNIYYEIFQNLNFDNLKKNHKISNCKKIKLLFKTIKEIFI